jgi:nitrous oxide reductase accessory protein NosL
MFKFFSVIFIVLIFFGCEKKDITSVQKVHWDRDMCERCKMVVSDRKHTVEVINAKTGKKYLFDDIGCMMLWFDEEDISWKDSAIIWITDVKTGEWIDARSAYYDTINLTPMSYGIGAHKKRSDIKDGEEVLDFTTIKPHILKIENQLNKKSH